jgi:hypothetical protein
MSAIWCGFGLARDFRGPTADGNSMMVARQLHAPRVAGQVLQVSNNRRGPVASFKLSAAVKSPAGQKIHHEFGDNPIGLTAC